MPVINWVGLQAAGTRVGVAQMEGGWLSPEKVKLVADAVLAACDALDGLADGIVSDYEGCVRAFDSDDAALPAWHRLGRLPLGGAAAHRAGRCTHRFEFPFRWRTACARYPAWGRGGEGAQGTGPVGGWISWQTGNRKADVAAGPDSSRGWLYGSGAVQYFFVREVSFDPRRFDPEAHASGYARSRS